MRARKTLLVLGLAAIVLTGPMAGAEPGAVNATAAFARLKTLEGSWQSAKVAGTPGAGATTTFDVIAMGTVLSERYANPALPGGGKMLTAYHVDGDALVLTHYCIAHNQPMLRVAQFDAARNEIQFEFVRATNLASPGAGHMRRAKYRLLGPDRFVTEWEYFENGALKATEVEEFVRVR